MIIILGLIGVVVGIFSGFTGLGGGILLIPALLYYFKAQGILTSYAMQIAGNTALAVVCCISLVSSYQHHRHKRIHWQMVRSFLPGLVIGIGCGSVLANRLNTQALEQSFGLLLLLIVLHLLWPQKKQVDKQQSPPPVIYLASIITGFLAPMFGIGGGMLMIPFFHAQGLVFLEAIATSVFCLLPISIISLAANTLLGYLHHTLALDSIHTIGFLYWPGLLCIVPMSMLSTPIGIYLAKKTDTRIIKRVLACMILLTAISLLTG